MRINLIAAALFTGALLQPLAAQQQGTEGPLPTQVLVSFDSKTPVNPTPQNLSLKLNNRDITINTLTPVRPNGAQVAILIDDGLRSSVGRQLSDLKDFVTALPPGTQVFIGYMQNGRVAPAQTFTTDRNAAAAAFRLPIGSAGMSASPYFCLSDFVKKWPAPAEGHQGRSARFILMITNGVDPYNGSTSITNQNSPYVDSAISDAQRAGAAVYSIYYTDSGYGHRGSFSGQSYLAQVAQGTGGVAYYQGTGNPVSMSPFLKQFRDAITETWIASFTAPANKNLVSLKVSTNLPKTKVRAASEVQPGHQIVGQ
jgi:hypothetical protein